MMFVPPVGMIYQDSHYCSLQDSQLAKTDDYFLLQQCEQHLQH